MSEEFILSFTKSEYDIRFFLEFTMFSSKFLTNGSKNFSPRQCIESQIFEKKIRNFYESFSFQVNPEKSGVIFWLN